MTANPFAKQIRFLLRQKKRFLREKEHAESRIKVYDQKIERVNDELNRVIRKSTEI